MNEQINGCGDGEKGSKVKGRKNYLLRSSAS